MFKRKERGGGESDGEEAVQKFPFCINFNYVINTQFLVPLPAWTTRPPASVASLVSYTYVYFPQEQPKGGSASKI